MLPLIAIVVFQPFKEFVLTGHRQFVIAVSALIWVVFVATRLLLEIVLDFPVNDINSP
jgi:hypothetical protein